MGGWWGAEPLTSASICSISQLCTSGYMGHGSNLSNQCPGSPGWTESRRWCQIDSRLPGAAGCHPGQIPHLRVPCFTRNHNFNELQYFQRPTCFHIQIFIRAQIQNGLCACPCTYILSMAVIRVFTNVLWRSQRCEVLIGLVSVILAWPQQLIARPFTLTHVTGENQPMSPTPNVRD